MKLSKEQIAFYNENGYLKIENYFSENEIDLLCREYPKTIDQSSPRIILEDNGDIRSVFSPHFVNSYYDKLSKLERLVFPSEQLLESKIYLHQYKINTKKKLRGDIWEWHQDFPYWNIDDGIQKPDLVSVMLYLNDTDASNGALLLIPGSHKEGIAKFASKLPGKLDDGVANINFNVANYLSSLNSNLKFTVDQNIVNEFEKKNGIIIASGKRGTAFFFHSNIFHSSNVNLSPFDRNIIIITYNSVNNLPEKIEDPRPEFLVGRNYTPLESLNEKHL